MKDPAFLFYSSDFLTGCIDLTMEERGQYITLICLQHQKGHLSSKMISLAVGAVSPDVMSKLKQDDDGLYYIKRVDEEIAKRVAFAESRRINGMKGGRPKKPSGKPNDKPNDKPSENLAENDNINIIINKLKNILVNYHKRDFSIRNWRDSVDKMLRIDKVPFDDVIKCLDWYAKHIGEDFVPVVASGSSLREKYVKLENAVKRDLPKDNIQNFIPDAKREQESRLARMAELAKIESMKRVQQKYGA